VNCFSRRVTGILAATAGAAGTILCDSDDIAPGGHCPEPRATLSEVEIRMRPARSCSVCSSPAAVRSGSVGMYRCPCRARRRVSPLFTADGAKSDQMFKDKSDGCVRAVFSPSA
jgi:ribosomal protein L37AE/L43A